MSNTRSRRPTRRRPGGKARRKAKYADLATYILKTHDTQAKIAAAVGSTQAYISRVAAGRTVPRASLALKIAEYAKIPFDSFARAYLKRTAGQAAPKQPAA